MPSEQSDITTAHELRRLADELGAMIERAGWRGWAGLASQLLDAQEAVERALVDLQEGRLP